MRRLVSLMAALCIATTPTVAMAATPTPDQTTIVGEVDSTAELATVIETVSSLDSQAGLNYLREVYGSTEIEETANTLGIVLPPEQTAGGPNRMPAFLTCMRDKIWEDVGAAFDFNLVIVLIDTKKWAEAAEVIVKTVAKQGIKRNVYVMAGLLAWWAVQCA